MIHGRRIEVFDRNAGSTVVVDPRHVVRMFKPTDGADDDPTDLVMDDGRIVRSDDSIRTITARFGRHGEFTDYDHGDGTRPSLVNLCFVVALTKPVEDYLSSEDDPTEIHLLTGETLRTKDSIRTIEARMGFLDIETSPLDIPGTDRPALVVPRHVQDAAEGFVLFVNGWILLGNRYMMTPVTAPVPVDVRFRTHFGPGV